MSRKNYNSFIKHQKAEKKRKRKEEKLQKRSEKKADSDTTFEDMIAYVDKDGNIVSEPPEEKNKESDQNSETNQ